MRSGPSVDTRVHSKPCKGPPSTIPPLAQLAVQAGDSASRACRPVGRPPCKQPPTQRDQRRWVGRTISHYLGRRRATKRFPVNDRLCLRRQLRRGNEPFPAFPDCARPPARSVSRYPGKPFLGEGVNGVVGPRSRRRTKSQRCGVASSALGPPSLFKPSVCLCSPTRRPRS
jgi:hypothetical protein